MAVKGKTGPSLSIIIPAYNEERRIGPTLDEILSFIASQTYTSEVIVIDDGSEDGTSAIVCERVHRYQLAGFALRVVRNEPNRGKGYSVKRGIEEAEGAIALFTDADLSSPITEAPKLLEPITAGTADLVFGSRALRRDLIAVRQPRARDFAGRSFNLFVKLMTGLPFKDTQCGFKAFRREALLPVFRLMRVERFGFDPEMLYIARKFGLRLLEVPVVWNHSEGSKVRFVRDSSRMLLDLATIRINHRLGYYDVHVPDDAEMLRRPSLSG
jgi:glycosyltransferase involved in cell wall biosynthesis